MTLKDYIDDPARRHALADEIGTSPQYLWQLATGWRGKRPSRVMALAIQRCTHGKVSAADLRPDLWPEGEAA